MKSSVYSYLVRRGHGNILLELWPSVLLLVPLQRFYPGVELGIVLGFETFLNYTSSNLYPKNYNIGFIIYAMFKKKLICKY